jgi:hypothetical protein
MLGAIGAAFKKAGAMAERFAKKDSSTTSGIRSASGNLTAEHEARTKELQKGTGLGHKVRWFVGDKSTMAALAKEVSALEKRIGMQRLIIYTG